MADTSWCAAPEIAANHGASEVPMALGRPKPPLLLSEGEIQQRQALAGSRSLPPSIVQRAQILLGWGAGERRTYQDDKAGEAPTEKAPTGAPTPWLQTFPERLQS